MAASAAARPGCWDTAQPARSGARPGRNPHGKLGGSLDLVGRKEAAMRTGTRLIVVLLLLLSSALLLAHTASADIVYLKNGRSFDGVVADESGSQVRVQIEGGS